MIRSVLHGWVFNPQKRQQDDKPERVDATLGWIERNSRPLVAVMQPEIARAIREPS